MKPQIYHNTTNLSGLALRDAVARAQKQKEAILLIFKETRGKYSPSQIHGMLERAGKPALIGSVRRSMTDLTTDGHLIHLKEQMPGPHKVPEGLWTINPEKYPTDTGFKQAPLFPS